MCLGVSPVHLRHSRVFLRVPSVSLRAHTPPSARLGWTPPLPGCTGWRHDKKSEKTRKISKFRDFSCFSRMLLRCVRGAPSTPPALPRASVRSDSRARLELRAVSCRGSWATLDSSKRPFSPWCSTERVFARRAG